MKHVMLEAGTVIHAAATLRRSAALHGLVSLLALAAFDAPPVAAQEDRPVPIHVEILHPPVLAHAHDATWLVYELHLTNWFRGAFTIHAINVYAASDSAAPLARFEGTRLTANLKHFPAASDTVGVEVLEPGRRVALMAWVPVDLMDLPSALLHRITVAAGSGDATFAMFAGPQPVEVRAPVIIGPPLRGGPWIVANGPNPDAVPGHSRLVYPKNGRIAFPQRFSADWLLLGSDGRVWRDDIASNEQWYTYAQDVLAVADGSVVLVRDSIIENTPPEVNTPMTQATVAGNLIVLDIGEGRYAVYGHLQPGSIRVRPGQAVGKGELIARVGNSGFSTGPHLHFHILDAPSHAAGEGLPFLIDRYTAIGTLSRTLDELDAGATEPLPVGGVPRENELPTDGAIIRF